MVLAYSGGLDSRFLAYAALCAGVGVELVHVRGPHVAAADTAFALDWAGQQGLSVQTMWLDPLPLPEVAGGSKDRCYACKRFLFDAIRKNCTGFLCDGTNASDLRLFRPGQRALKELGVRSPLAEGDLTKDAIRLLAGHVGLSRPDQQARACLLTRLPYGVAPGIKILDTLARAEAAVESVLMDAGCIDSPFRLRMMENGRFELHLGLEAMSHELGEELGRCLRREGLVGTSVRLMQKVSGYFDEHEVSRTSASPSCIGPIQDDTSALDD